MKTEQKIYAALAVLALGAGGLYWTSQSKKEQVAKHSVTAASADLPSVSVPKDDGEFIDSCEPAPGIRCTGPLQTYLDLSRAGDRGREAADHLRKTCLDPHWSTLS